MEINVISSRIGGIDMKYKGKIGYVTNDKLYGGDPNHGHYVIVKGYDEKNRKFVVNKITSLEVKPYSYHSHRIDKIRDGHLVPISKKDSNFSKWSAIDKTNHEVYLSDINFKNHKRIKRIYQFIIRKK